MLARESVCQKSSLLVAADINEISGRGNEVTTLLGLCTSIDESMLEEIFPGELRVEETAVLDPQTKRVSNRRRRLFRDLVLEDRESGEPSAHAAAELLVREIVEGRCKLTQWDESVDQWIFRLNTMARLFPEFEVSPLLEADYGLIYEQLCMGARSHKDIRARSLWPALKSWLSAEQLGALEDLFPERFAMPNGRNARIRYAKEGSATLSARIQDFYDMKQHPTIASGRLRLRIEFLAPNQRPIQITDNLERFWTDSYPQIKRELAGRYPKHDWR
jgi:ATP-dependent helicase HrpB